MDNLEFDLETKYEGPNVYWHDYDHHHYPAITFITWAKTPKGKRSKFYQQYRIKKKGSFSNYTREQAIAKAREYFKVVNLPKLRKGYTWGAVQIQFDHWK